MARRTFIGATSYFTCDCGFHGEIYWSKGQQVFCPRCGTELFNEEVIHARKNSILVGNWAESPESDLYVRPDKDHPRSEAARKWFLTGHRCQGMEDRGEFKNRPGYLDDVKAIIKVWGGVE